MTVKLTKEQRKAIPELRAKGLHVQDIARSLGVPKSCVVFWSDPEKWRPRWAEASEKERQNRPDRVKERHRDWHRKHATRLKTGEYISHADSKRPYPQGGLCELCRRRARLDYHHWDDSCPTLGVWVCKRCHPPAELLDFPPSEEFVRRYAELKASVVKEVGI